MRIVGDKAMLLALVVGVLLLFFPVSAVEVTWLLGGLILSAVWGAPARGGSAPLIPAGALGLISALLLLLPASCPAAPSVALMAASTFPAYDLARMARGRERRCRHLLAAAPVLSALLGRGAQAGVLVGAAGILLAILLARRTRDADEAAERLSLMRDELGAKVRALEDSNARLSEALEHEPRAAALAERTRIARDIHDTLGHLLTRGVFQVNALRVMHPGEGALGAQLDALADTLDEAMSSMRSSVHALADEAEDLEASLNILAARSTIPETGVECLIEASPPARVARTIIALAREALTNAERHGRARSARIRVAEYPAFWQVTADNDGEAPAWTDEAGRLRAEEAGLGLRSMRTRVEALGGRLRITVRPRFTVFATIPKEEG